RADLPVIHLAEGRQRRERLLQLRRRDQQGGGFHRRGAGVAAHLGSDRLRRAHALLGVLPEQAHQGGLDDRSLGLVGLVLAVDGGVGRRGIGPHQRRLGGRAGREEDERERRAPGAWNVHAVVDVPGQGLVPHYGCTSRNPP